MTGDKLIAAYIEGIYAAADAIKAGVKLQNAGEILDAAGIFQITKNFRRHENTATWGDVRAAAKFWKDTAEGSRSRRPADAALYEKYAGAFCDILAACRG